MVDRAEKLAGDYPVSVSAVTQVGRLAVCCAVGVAAFRVSESGMGVFGDSTHDAMGTALVLRADSELECLPMSRDASYVTSTAIAVRLGSDLVPFLSQVTEHFTASVGSALMAPDLSRLDGVCPTYGSALMPASLYDRSDLYSGTCSTFDDLTLLVLEHDHYDDLDSMAFIMYHLVPTFFDFYDCFMLVYQCVSLLEAYARHRAIIG